MTTLVHESDSHAIMRKEPLRRDRAQQHGEQTGLLAAAHAEIARTLSPDPVEFLEQHRQRDGE